MGIGSAIHLHIRVARKLATFGGQQSDILALLAHGQPSESSILLTCGKSQSCSHSSYAPSSGNPSKRFLSGQAGGFDKLCGLLILRRACHSDKDGLLT